MLLFSSLVPFCFSILLAVLIIPRILLVSRKKHLYDLPDSRKVHQTPVPRLGGISFFPAILISVMLTTALRYKMGLPVDGLAQNDLFVKFAILIVGTTLLFLVGVTDDLISVAYRSKFGIQLFCAALLPIFGLWIDDLNGLFGIHEIPAWLGMPLTVFVVVYITNAVNLIDGVDGLASGLCCIALLALGAICLLNRQYIFVTLAAATLGIVIPFWIYNVFGNAKRGRKLFMGDTGSLTLGYLLSFLVIYLAREGGHTYPQGMLMICFSTLVIPLFDVVRVVLVRCIQQKNPFLPDKNHIHHKLLRTGLRVRWVMIVLLLVSIVFICLNVAGVYAGADLTLLFFATILLWVAFHLTLSFFTRRHRLRGGKVSDRLYD